MVLTLKVQCCVMHNAMFMFSLWGCSVDLYSTCVPMHFFCMVESRDRMDFIITGYRGDLTHELMSEVEFKLDYFHFCPRTIFGKRPELSEKENQLLVIPAKNKTKQGDTVNLIALLQTRNVDLCNFAWILFMLLRYNIKH